MYSITKNLKNNPTTTNVFVKYFCVNKKPPNTTDLPITTAPSPPTSKFAQHLEAASSKTTKFVPKNAHQNVSKEDLKWRTAWHERQGQHFSALRTLYSEDNQTATLKWMQTSIDLRPSALRKWWTKRNETREIVMQSYQDERNQTVGNELAAAHFLVHRGGAVKFHNDAKWITQEMYHTLPRLYDSEKVVQAIDCSDMVLYYEGLANLGGLKAVEWASFNGVSLLDDWYLDRIGWLFADTLVYLDLRNCVNYTERGLAALYKMEKLKILCVDDMRMTTSFEMTCLLLQDANPHLDIRVGVEQ